MNDVERLAGRDADAAPLADRIAQDAFVAAKRASVYVDDVTRPGRGWLQLGDDVGIFSLRYEADVLAVGLIGDDQPHFLGDGAHLRLRHAAERKAQVVDLLLRSGEQEVALVTVRIDGAIERPVRSVLPRADVVAGCECCRAEFLRGGQEVSELDGLVAGHAGDRGLEGDIALGEGIDHRLAEAILVVQHVMRNA